MIRIFMFLFLTLLSAPALAREGADVPDYGQALEDLGKNRTTTAEILVARGGDPVLNNVLQGRLMALPGNDYSFEEMTTFILEHRTWADLAGIRMMAERKMPDGLASDQVVNWFAANPPLTSVGFARYIDALNATGREAMAIKLVRARWVEKDFSAQDVVAFRARYAPLLRRKEHEARLERLLWERKPSAVVQKMYPFVTAADKAVAEARIGLYEGKRDFTARLKRVPAARQNDPGLLYERARWRRQKGLDSEALAILESRPVGHAHALDWWREVHIAARKLMERKAFGRAYKLVIAHSLSEEDGFEYLQAEFLAGWIALHHLHKPDAARRHFEKMVAVSQSPISTARAQYWLGRAREALGQKDLAVASYEAAAVFSTAFYGQLALARLADNALIQARPEPAIPGGVRQAFFSRDVVRAVRRLTDLGFSRWAESFFWAIAGEASRRVDFALLMDLAHAIERPDLAIRVSKKASQQGFLLTGGAYPLLAYEIPIPPDIAFTHALIRQESMFHPSAKSSAGAQGLMQLMPATAKETAEKIGVSYRSSRLAEPSYNLKLGTAFIQRQIDAFDGSYILALAAYNAGPRRAREWIDLYGDPREADVDPVDWIESIPIYETRNYIQRIIENLQFYRALLDGGQARLQIEQDLKRLDDL